MQTLVFEREFALSLGVTIEIWNDNLSGCKALLGLGIGGIPVKSLLIFRTQKGLFILATRMENWYSSCHY